MEQAGDSAYSVIFTVSQDITDGTESRLVTSAYEVCVYADDSGDMVIIRNPTITGKPAKSGYAPKVAEPDGTVSAQESAEITEFLTAFLRCILRPAGRSFLTMQAAAYCR